ncbi:hypothetical protein [Streptomyces sp. NPDC008121]|uniref:hypothetical protein n=1 Tax=Streptomyces sp. NPDC008121 TaxID=3364809 RepID=UPI0036E82BF8
MIKNLARGLAALSLALTPLAAPAAAHAAPAGSAVLALADALAELPLADEDRARRTR